MLYTRLVLSFRQLLASSCREGLDALKALGPSVPRIAGVSFTVLTIVALIVVPLCSPPLLWLPEPGKADILLGTLLTAQAAIAALTLAVTLFVMQGVSTRRDIDDRVYSEYVRQSWVKIIFWGSLLALGVTGTSFIGEKFISGVGQIADATPGLRNLSLMAAFAFMGNLGLVGVLFGRAIHFAHPSQWNTLRRNVNERDVRDAVQVFLRRNQRVAASLEASEPDLTAVFPDPDEGSANEAVRALLDDALRAMAERRQQDFARCLESIQDLISYAMDHIEHMGMKWGTPGHQPAWPPLSELGNNLYSFREEVIREGHQEYVFKLSSLDFWLVHIGVNRRCGELFTTGLEGYRLNYQLSNRIGNAHWREIFRNRIWIEVHWLIVSEEAGEVFPYADAMVRLQENLLADAMHSDLPGDYEQLHTAFEAALQAIRYSWHVDSWPPPESLVPFPESLTIIKKIR